MSYGSRWPVLIVRLGQGQTPYLWKTDVFNNSWPLPWKIPKLGTVDAHTKYMASFDLQVTWSKVKLLIIIFMVTVISIIFCLFVCGFSSQSRIFHSHGHVTITSDRLQILTCACHSWPLNSEGSMVCHTFGNTGHTFIIVIFEDLWR